MPNDDRYSEERYNSALAHCNKLELTFDGSTFKLSGGSKEYTYQAVSGSPLKNGSFDYSKERQKAAKVGPIPGGKYWVNPDEIWENAWYKRGSYESWGKYRLTIHPFTTTNTYKRGGFFIHGGKVPGSLGCIDLTSHVDRFVNDLDKKGARRKCQIHLTVQYATEKKL